MKEMEDLLKHIEESFYKPDLQAARIIIGTAYAHYFKDVDPIWMFVVGPPSSGKTAITITALSGLTGMFGEAKSGYKKPWGPVIEYNPDTGKVWQSNKDYKEAEAVEILSTINPNTFLSHQIGVDDPGLLEQISKNKPHYEKDGTHKIVRGNALVLIPDFTVLASMRRELRGEIMGQLRRIYDGQFEKKVGTRVTKIWEGKLSILAATTPVIDKYTSIDSSLGERFIQINWRASTDHLRGRFTLKAMRAKAQGKLVARPLKAMLCKLFAKGNCSLLECEDDRVDTRLAALAEITADARASVYGQVFDNQYQVKEISGAEDVHRIIQQFFAVVSGITRVQGREVPNEDDMQDVLRTGMETLPTYRSVVLQAGCQGRPISDYGGNDREKRIEAVKLAALGIIDAGADQGRGPVKLKDKWKRIIDLCEFNFDTVFEDGGMAAGRERADAQSVVSVEKGFEEGTVF